MNTLGGRHLIASAVQGLHGKDHRFKTYEVGEHELVLHLGRGETHPQELARRAAH